MTSLRLAPRAPCGHLPEQIELLPIARLRPYARNPRLHAEDQVARLAASLIEYGWTQPILITDDGTVVAGHGRLLTAQRLGINAVPVIRLQHLTEVQARAYRIGDNQLALAASWDEDALATELHALNGEAYDLGLLGFDDGEIERLLAPLDDATATIDENADDGSLDETPAPPWQPVSRPGDLWLMGGHRLLCGDSSEAAALATPMAGEQAALTFTSGTPPTRWSTRRRRRRYASASPSRQPPIRAARSGSGSAR